MSLETTLTDIIARLRQGRFPNEQAISQGIAGASACHPERVEGSLSFLPGKRRYIARTPEELYPDREAESHTSEARRHDGVFVANLREMREALPGGWLVATNLNNILKRTIIKLAAEVAGLAFGKDVVVEF